MKFYLLSALIYLINTLIITTIIDIILMGALHLRLSFGCRIKQFLITKENRMDFQTGNECAAFSSAYVLRHWGIEENGTSLYERITGKRRDGTVYPAGIRRLLSGYGFRTRYCAGTLGALKREVAKGNPVIVLLRTYAGKSWLHYVPVIGWDENYFFIAESFRELVNCDERCYNRRVTTEEFKRLWNTAGWKMPLYRNTYITAIKDAPEVRKTNGAKPLTGLAGKERENELQINCGYCGYADFLLSDLAPVAGDEVGGEGNSGECGGRIRRAGLRKMAAVL